MCASTSQRAPWRGGWLDYTDHCVDRRGSELTLVLVHGLGGSRRHYDRLAARWTASRVLALDLPGFGGSTPIAGPVTVDDLARAVVAVLDHAQVTEALLVGHSMGGPIALRCAELDGPRVRGVVLLAGTVQTFTATLGRRVRPWFTAPRTALATLVELISVCLPIPRRLARMLSRSRPGRIAGLWPFVQHPGRLGEADAALLLSGAGSPGAWATARALGRLGAWDARHQPRCPVYAVNGRADRIAPLSDLESIRVPIAARFVVESGHMLMLERVDELVDILGEVHARGPEPEQGAPAAHSEQESTA